MYASNAEISKQLQFCNDLMSRMKKEYKCDNEKSEIKRSMLINDARRLRRELNTVIHMCMWDYKNMSKG